MAAKKRYSSIYSKAMKNTEILSPNFAQEGSISRLGEDQQVIMNLNAVIQKQSRARKRTTLMSIDRGAVRNRLSRLSIEGSPNLDTILSVHDTS